MVAHCHGGPRLVRTTVPWPPPRHVFIPAAILPGLTYMALEVRVSPELLEMQQECYEFDRLGTETGRPVAHYVPQTVAACRRLGESVDAAYMRLPGATERKNPWP